LTPGKLEHLVKYAYEIQELYAVPESLSLAESITNGWLKGPPQRYCYAKRNMTQALDLHKMKAIFASACVPGELAQLRRSGSVPLAPGGKGSERNVFRKRAFGASSMSDDEVATPYL
jgi:hypothetical protein